MEITAVITKELYQEFLKYAFKGVTKKGRLKWLYQGAGFFFGIFAVTSVLYFYEASKYTKHISSSGLDNAFWVSLFALASWLTLSYMFRKEISATGLNVNGTTLGEFTYILDDDGIKEIGEIHTFECSWSSITEVIQTPNLILFSLDPLKGIIIPFNDEEHAENIIEYSSSRIRHKESLTL